MNNNIKTAVAFIDGQNLFYAVKNAFGYTYPNYDVSKLAKAICENKKWNLSRIYFYTGIPSSEKDKYWFDFWTKKLAYMGRGGVHIFTRRLSYYGNEKGIDIRIALDVIRLAREKVYDVGVIFSQDQDFTELVTEVKEISKLYGKNITLACAFPKYSNSHGIIGTDWIEIEKKLYDKCIDTRNYRS